MLSFPLNPFLSFNQLSALFPSSASSSATPPSPFPLLSAPFYLPLCLLPLLAPPAFRFPPTLTSTAALPLSSHSLFLALCFYSTRSDLAMLPLRKRVGWN
eukprot:TRINITY_DN27034_c0_g2_i1.p3 TRINITY_DN27034_c0_g2~~TRINITY_DN27034_c0_g2_i1.p3  ORF type:complete len:100 (-),score=6.46 TRINITY_DN27034_c0_g2_i1:82-381(-)